MGGQIFMKFGMIAMSLETIKNSYMSVDYNDYIDVFGAQNREFRR